MDKHTLGVTPLMLEPDVSLRGDLIQWARQVQGLSMRDIAARGGPSLAYQSEVECAKKLQVNSDRLAAWARALNVTLPFVRGMLPRYPDSSGACKGLASDIGRVIAKTPLEWSCLTVNERARRVLSSISTESPNFPRVVLAYVLGLDVVKLDAFSAGALPLPPWLYDALGELTLLPDSFFRYGLFEGLEPAEVRDAYLAVIEVAKSRGITPVDLRRIIDLWDQPLAVVLGSKVGNTGAVN